MKNEMMSSGKGKRKITLDPRTKLALLLMVATFVLGGAGGNELIWARILLAIIPAILLLFSGKVKAFFVFEMLFLAGCLLQYYLLGMLRFDKAVMIKLNKTKALQWQMRL